MKGNEVREVGLQLLNKIRDTDAIQSPEQIASAMLTISATFLIEIAAQLAEFNERENGKL